MSDIHHSIWSVWPLLSIWPKLFFLTLVVMCIYVIVNAALIVARLRTVERHMGVENDPSSRTSLARLQTRCTNLAQTLTAAFYLFGFAFFMALPAATFVLDSRLPATTIMLRNVVIDFVFAANVFLVLLVLHALQWWVSSRVSAHALRLPD